MVGTKEELGERIRQLRLARGLDQASLSKLIQLDRSKISRIETGERQVTALELMRIARALQVSMPDLMTVIPPSVKAARQLLADEASASDASRALARDETVLDRMWRDAEQLREAGALHASHVLDAPATWSSAEQAQQLARDLRNSLELPSAPLGGMLDVAFRCGLFIHVTPLESRAGLSMTPDPGFGVSVVSATDPSGRRRMTAAHELGHHLSGDVFQADLVVNASHQERERLINAFAVELLLPESVVQTAWAKEASRDTAIRLAFTYRVSWSVVAISLQSVDPKADDIVKSSLVPGDADFYRVCASKPEEDLTEPVAGAWVQACVTAAESQFVTPARARELARGALAS